MDIFNKIINNMHASKKRHNCVGGGGTHHSPPPGDLSYSKRGPRPPRCVEGAYALGWGAAAPQAMVGSKAAGHHGVPETSSES